ncbi:ATP-dependent Clp protease proteolytic subunit [Pseudonocardia parietis]|uniref:ATP-dependent Clp protease proteolytic subunit n=1 Tax=Pseudonocardia parietis TaxID=570936 RepID=A0ABS4W4Q8_9PSEU|nr:ATP-dependent Clp protease proteolytic subunit [Pseudonocardia parietis]MBP2371189.1 ATP-dependent Clp protease protease subunit [Pseudonocardia parietis]
MPVLSTTSELADRLLGERIVLLSRELDDDVAAETCARLLLLAAEDTHREVTLQIASPGGSPVAAMVVHDTVRTLGVDVATVAIGSLAGPVPFLVASGTAGKRFALPHAAFLPSADGQVRGAHPGDVRVRADHLARRRDEIEALTARYCGGPLPAEARERWLSADEAVACGLADRIRGVDS